MLLWNCCYIVAMDGGQLIDHPIITHPVTGEQVPVEDALGEYGPVTEQDRREAAGLAEADVITLLDALPPGPSDNTLPDLPKDTDVIMEPHLTPPHTPNKKTVIHKPVYEPISPVNADVIKESSFATPEHRPSTPTYQPIIPVVPPVREGEIKATVSSITVKSSTSGRITRAPSKDINVTVKTKTKVNAKSSQESKNSKKSKKPRKPKKTKKITEEERKLNLHLPSIGEQLSLLPSAKKLEKALDAPPRKYRIPHGKDDKERSTKALREIWKYQKSYDFLISKAPFIRTVRQLTRQMSADIRYTPEALFALQACAEQYLVQILEHCNLASIHAKRKTIRPVDLQFILKIWEDINPMGHVFR